MTHRLHVQDEGEGEDDRGGGGGVGGGQRNACCVILLFSTEAPTSTFKMSRSHKTVLGFRVRSRVNAHEDVLSQWEGCRVGVGVGGGGGVKKEKEKAEEAWLRLVQRRQESFHVQQMQRRLWGDRVCDPTVQSTTKVSRSDHLRTTGESIGKTIINWATGVCGFEASFETLLLELLR